MAIRKEKGHDYTVPTYAWRVSTTRTFLLPAFLTLSGDDDGLP